MTESEFKKLVLAHKDRVFSYASYLMHNRDEAEDITQEVFVRLWKNAERVDMTCLRAWLLRVAHNLCIDRARRRNFERRAFIPLDGVPGPARQNRDPEEDPAGGFDRNELQRNVLSAMQHLSKSLRSVIILREIQGLSYQEISEILNVPLNTVKVNIHRARQALRKDLAPLLNMSIGEQA
jgi:RNA polymerase sigma-70 factor (ECF subfamily)